MPTMTTVINVAISRPTHINPMLLAVSATFIDPIMPRNMA